MALAEYMHRDLVERRRWIPENDYRDGLALAQLAPGPLAAQLAIYIGFVHHRVLGATLAGVAFVVPSFLMVIGLGWAYVAYGGLPWMQSVFYAVGAAVIGIIANSAYRLTRKTLGRTTLLWGIYLVSAVATALTETEDVRLILAGGVLAWLVHARPWSRWSGALPGVLAVPLTGIDPDLLGRIFAFFTYAGAFVFGSGLAIVPFLYGGLVTRHAWLTEQQFLDAVAVALITPGPVVITTGFIGYLLAGLPGATVAATATFLPAYLLTIIPAPWFRRYGRQPSVAAFVNGVTAAAIGAISGAVVVLGRRSVTDLPTALIAVAAVLLLWRWRVPEPLLILAATLVGLVL